MPPFHKIPFSYIDQKSLLVHRLLDYENEESVDKFVSPNYRETRTTDGACGIGFFYRVGLFWTKPDIKPDKKTRYFFESLI